MHFSGSADMLMVRIAKFSAGINQWRHWRRPEFYPVGLTGGALLFTKMVVANAVSGTVVSGTVVSGTVVSGTVVSTLVVVVATVVVVVGVVVTGLLIIEVVDVVTIVGFAVMLNDIAVRIRASAIGTNGC